MEVYRLAMAIQKSMSKNDPLSVSPHQPCSICAIPLFHVTACHHIFLSSFVEGRKIVLMYKWNSTSALKLIEQERCTTWAGVPTMVQDLLTDPSFSHYDLSSLQSVGAGGAPTPPSLVPAVVEKFKADASIGYGMETETNGGIAFNKGLNYVNKPRSCGSPWPIVEVKVIDLETGEDLGKNRRGELCIKSSLNMKEYWNKPEATRKVFLEDRWLRTGDIAEIDDDGFIYIVDRAKDLIIRGGENISCAEVEGAFYTHPAVHECSAFAIPDERLGEVVGLMVYVDPRHHATAEELIHHVNGKLAHFKIPDISCVFFTPEPLPRGGTGKIDKKSIRQDVVNLLKKKSKL
eukprot:TRINITY_DN2067_c0_g1_i7.p1 TRINITY_DN2067_c0_g1~~TRINITY_DN2067_c0_g1_i7.p1  ORF type:complete len:347 (-),score=79.99 TRINITY_DN2067_c0_g1_i7:1540-2580(-)